MCNKCLVRSKLLIIIGRVIVHSWMICALNKCVEWGGKWGWDLAHTLLIKLWVLASIQGRHLLLTPSLKGGSFFLIHTDMPYMSGPWTLAPVTFPFLHPSSSWCRLSPSTWAGPTCSHKSTSLFSCSLVISPLFSLCLPLFSRVTGLNDFIHVFMEAWSFKKLWGATAAAAAAGRGVRKSVTN